MKGLQCSSIHGQLLLKQLLRDVKHFAVVNTLAYCSVSPMHYLQEDSDLPDEDDEVEDEERSLPPVQFIVSVTKTNDNKALAFNCQTSGKDIIITQVSLNDIAAEEGEEEGSFAPYTGPMFEELDDTLQQAFIDYLEERGINSDFGYYLMELVHDKLEVEYMNWLTRVQGFVANE